MRRELKRQRAKLPPQLLLAEPGVLVDMRRPADVLVQMARNAAGDSVGSSFDGSAGVPDGASHSSFGPGLHPGPFPPFLWGGQWLIIAQVHFCSKVPMGQEKDRRGKVNNQ